MKAMVVNNGPNMTCSVVFQVALVLSASAALPAVACGVVSQFARGKGILLAGAFGLPSLYLC